MNSLIRAFPHPPAGYDANITQNPSHRVAVRQFQARARSTAPTWPMRRHGITAARSRAGLEPAGLSTITNISALRWNEFQIPGRHRRWTGADGRLPGSCEAALLLSGETAAQDDQLRGRSTSLAAPPTSRTRSTNRINGQFVGFNLAPTFNTEKTTSWSVYGQAALRSRSLYPDPARSAYIQ